MNDDAKRIDLSAAIEALRSELEEALAASKGQKVSFQVSELTMTLQTVASKDFKAGGKLRWWVVEAGADRGSGHEATQTLELKLLPRVLDKDGRTVPLDVADNQKRPGL